MSLAVRGINFVGKVVMLWSCGSPKATYVVVDLWNKTPSTIVSFVTTAARAARLKYLRLRTIADILLPNDHVLCRSLIVAPCMAFLHHEMAIPCATAMAKHTPAHFMRISS